MSEGENSVSGRLILHHRCLAWLSYIHLCEFGTLPAHLYDPTNSNPSRIVSLEHFLFPWSSSEDVHTPPERLIKLFKGKPPPTSYHILHPLQQVVWDDDDGMYVCVYSLQMRYRGVWTRVFLLLNGRLHVCLCTSTCSICSEFLEGKHTR